MSLDVSRVKALCFDVDGTLNDTDDQMAATVAKMFKPLAFMFTRRDYVHAARRFVMWAEAPGNTGLGFLDTLGMDDEFIASLEWLNRRRPRPMKHFHIIPGVREMLEALRGRYPMAVVSARDEKSTLAFLDRYELRPFFEGVVTALTVAHTKPYPDPVIYAAQTLGVTPAECLMIGDTTVDIRAGRAAGAQTVGVLCGFGEEDELRQRGADVILKGTWELGQILK